MDLNDVITLLTFIVTTIQVSFDIIWKISHDDKKDNNNKKD